MALLRGSLNNSPFFLCFDICGFVLGDLCFASLGVKQEEVQRSKLKEKLIDLARSYKRMTLAFGRSI
jgi:hypothetical protein